MLFRKTDKVKTQIDAYDIERFKTRYRECFNTVLAELSNGHKETHWIWFIFPQMIGLGYSDKCYEYGMHDVTEAKMFLEDEYLNTSFHRLLDVLLEIESDSIIDILGVPDDLKLRSSMTLFQLASPDDDIYQRVLDKYYDGKPDERTLKLLERIGIF